jgi:hypothetical protein
MHVWLLIQSQSKQQAVTDQIPDRHLSRTNTASQPESSITAGVVEFASSRLDGLTGRRRAREKHFVDTFADASVAAADGDSGNT